MLPTNTPTGSIDFNKLVQLMEIKYKFDFYDFAQRSKKKQQICKVLGIKHSEWHSKQFTKMTPLELKVVEIGDLIPYQNIWHWFYNNVFEDINRGEDADLCFSEALSIPSIPDYVKLFLDRLREELELHGVTNDTVTFYMS